MEFPLISVIVPTYNSERTLERTLKSIRLQKYPKTKIEILLIDGGSVDSTIKIAKKFGCKILNNPQVLQVYAKQIGFLKAKGKYLLNLDSDEVLENPLSFRLKCLAFKKNFKVKAVVPSGYKTPGRFSPINYYINEFGDPFSFFLFRESKSDKLLIKDFKRGYQKVFEDKNCVGFDFSDSLKLPLVELCAGGCMIDLKYAKSKFPQTKTQPGIIAHLFYLFNRDKKILAITKRDPTVHYSSDTFKRYLKKLKSRIKNNIFVTEMGRGGFLGRESFEPLTNNYKKYFFIPYTIFLLPPLFDSLYLVISRRRVVYFLHLPLCIYVSLLIIYYYFLKLLKVKVVVGAYGT